MSDELTRYEPAAPTGMDVMTLGATLAKSGYFTDAREAAQAVVKILAGQELGIGPIAAMTGVYLVNGRVAIGANLMAAAVKRSGRYDYRVAELSDTRCTVLFFERGQQIGESTFTYEDAKKAQTKNLDRFPRNMLFARALSNGVRWFCPDVFFTTVYTPDEMGDTTLVDVPAGTVNAATGELITPEEPAAVAVADDGRRTVDGTAEHVELAYTRSGKLTARFQVGDDTVLVLDAPEELAQLEDGDPVHVAGTIRTYKGAEVLAAETVTHQDGPDTWIARRAQQPLGVAA
jgi:hypothetical protein